MEQVTFVVPGALWQGFLAEAYGEHKQVEWTVHKQGRGTRVVVTAPVRIAKAIHRYLQDRSTLSHSSGVQSMYERYAARDTAKEIRQVLREAGAEVV